MAENTNCWIFLHKDLADAWEAWWEWYRSDRENQEPILHGWDKARIRGMVDADFAFTCFNPPQSWNGREWRLLSTYDISRGNINAGIQLHGDAFEGGDFNALGYWTWEDRYQEYSEQIKQIEYRPDIAILFMPGDIVQDINLAAGQPPRDLDPNINLMEFVRAMEAEGWEIEPKGRDRIRILYNGESYDITIQYLLKCDFSDLPKPLKDDIVDALHAQELCANVRKPNRKPGRKPRRKPRKKL